MPCAAEAGSTNRWGIATFLVLFLAACSTQGTEVPEPDVEQVPDYELDALLAVLNDEGICERRVLEDVEDSDQIEGWAECSDTAAPGGLGVLVYASENDRLSYLLGGLALGCGTNSADEDNDWAYVFGERWSIGPGYTLKPSDVEPTVDLLGTIAEATSGIVHRGTCLDLAIRVNVAQDLGDVHTQSWSKAIMNEPGSESDQIDQLDAAVAEVRATLPDS